jgi:hypothetical protein
MEAYGRLSDLAWYDPARPHVFLHLRARLSELTRAYAVLQQTPLRESFGDWVEERVDAIPKFAKYLDPVPSSLRLARKGATFASAAWGVLVLVAPIFGVTIGVATLGAAAIALLNTFVHTCFCKLYELTYLALAGAIVLVFVIGFRRKRRLLLGNGNPELGPNSYELEQKLFLELDEPRHGEFQFDVLGWFLMGAVFLLVWQGAGFFENHHFAHFAGWWPIYCLTVAGSLFAVATASLISSLKRPWAWKAML